MAKGTVYPVNNNKFKVGINGGETADTTIANLTNFAPSIEGGGRVESDGGGRLGRCYDDQ